MDELHGFCVRMLGHGEAAEAAERAGRQAAQGDRVQALTTAAAACRAHEDAEAETTDDRAEPGSMAEAVARELAQATAQLPERQREALALRELLGLFAHGADVGLKRQIDGVRSVGVRPVVRRHPAAGPIAFGRGLEIRVTIDDLSFEGGSAVLLGSVLHRYFARHVSMNSFAQTVLASLTRGDVMTWEPGVGARAVL